MTASPSREPGGGNGKWRRVSGLFEVQDAATARWLPMEGLRGFAVALVFLVHYTSFLDDRDEADWLAALHELGNVGVDLFFVLSGFLIYKACIQKPINLRLYAYRRIERIYPTFLIALLIYLALMLLLPSESKLPDGSLWDKIEYIAVNALLLPGMLPIEPIITVAWSLSYEVFYYLPVPILVVALGMRAWTPAQRFILFLAAYAAMIALATAGYDARFRLSMFLGGMMLYEATAMLPDARRKVSIWSDTAMLVIVLGTLALFVLLADEPIAVDSEMSGSLPDMTRFVLVNVAFVLLVYRSVFTAGPASRAFSWTPLRWLGNVSYSFYLLHGLGLHAFFLLLGKVWRPEHPGVGTFFLLLVPAFLAGLAAALPLYLLIERPLSLTPSASKPRAAKTPSKARERLSSKMLGP